MFHRRGRRTDRQLLRPCVLVTGAEHSEPLDDDTASCGACPVRCAVLEDTAGYLGDRVSETWTAISAAISARRSALHEALDQLAAAAAEAGAEGDRGRPIRTLVVSTSEPAAPALAARIAADARFALVGQASAPAEVVALAATGLPDLVLVHLPDMSRRAIEQLAELRQWSPGSVVVVVSGLDVRGVADLVTTSGVPDSWPRREPSRTGGGNEPGAGAGPPRAGRRRPGGQARIDPPKSIIQEAMRQIGVPMRSKP